MLARCVTYSSRIKTDISCCTTCDTCDSDTSDHVREKLKLLLQLEVEDDEQRGEDPLSRKFRFGRSCCITCHCETNNRVRDVFTQFELQGDEQHEEGERDVVFHPCNIQGVITVNPPAGFKLSLDILPCFQGNPHKLPAEGNEIDLYNQGWIAGSCNGLLLCSTGKFYQTKYYVTNPVTKQWVALPPAPRTHQIVYIGFIFDPCRNYNDDNNCCEAQTHHEPLHCNSCVFKVVRFDDGYQCYQYRSQFEVETFSSDTGHWTIATVSSPKLFRWDPNSKSLGALFHNGCLHWLGGSGDCGYDPYKNKFQGIIERPARSQCCQIKEGTFESLRSCRGALWLYQYSSISKYIRLWELKDYNNTDNSGNLNLDKCYWSLYNLCNMWEMKSICKWAPKYIGGFLAMHPYDLDIVYLQSMAIGDQYIVRCNLRTKRLGQRRLGCYGSRYPGDIHTLVFQAGSTTVPLT